MQLKSQADIDWFGWSFLWILNRQTLGFCLRLHFYELTPASDITSATQLNRCQRMQMHIYTDLKSNLLDWVIKTQQNQTIGSTYQDFRMNIQWTRSTYFPGDHQRHLLWYRDTLLIKVVDIEGHRRQTESRAEEFEEQRVQSGLCGGWHYVFLLQHLIYSFIWATFVRNTSCCCRAFSAL